MKKSGKDRLKYAACESTLSTAARSPFPKGEGCVSGITVFSYRSLPLWGRGTAPAVDRVLPQTTHLRRFLFHLYRLLETISPLFFIPLVPYPPLRGTFPSRGRLCVEDSVVLVSQPSPLGKGGCAAKRGWLPFLRRSRLLFAFPIGEGGPRQRWIGYCRKSST